MRNTIRHLRENKAVLLFPRGLLEPDPALIPGSVQSIRKWSESVGIFLSKAPDTLLQPLLLSHVVVPKAWTSPLVALNGNLKRRHQAAMIWQFMMQVLKNGEKWKIPMRAQLGEAVPARLLSAKLDPHEINMSIRSLMTDLVVDNYPDNS